jgi:hypothetical protein
MGRTIPPWRIIVDQELAKLSKFKQFLRAEDQIVFEDLLNQCKLYASAAGVLASSVKEFPLLFAILFAHHKRITELERRMKEELK